MTYNLPSVRVPAGEIVEALRMRSVEARPRLENGAAWDEAALRLGFLPVDYSQAMIDYQLAYFGSDGRRAEDASIILFHDNRPAAVWPLMVITETDGSRRICSQGGPVLPPLFSSQLAGKSVKALTGACVEAVIAVWECFGQSDRTVIEGFSGLESLSDWHDQWMLRSAELAVQHDLMCDLKRPLAEIRTSFRKSFKPLISQGLRLWNTYLVTDGDVGQWEDFHRLHIAVAGRVTRSDESWNRQLAAVSSGDAFFVVLRDAQDVMVGAALFHVTRDEGLYAVGAYDRSLFDKPLGHVAQALAIEEMHRRGLRWYRLGNRAYPSDVPSPSAKDISISDFKQGFSSHLLPRFRLNIARS